MEIDVIGKISSRRFLVFAIWTVLIGVDTVLNRSLNIELAKLYSIISVLYISSSVAKSFIFNKK